MSQWSSIVSDRRKHDLIKMATSAAPQDKTRHHVETQCCRSMLPSVSAANEDDETWNQGRK